MSVGPLRTRVLSFFAPFARDVVITGHDRDDVGMMVFADIEACASLCPDLSPRCSASEILHHDAVREHFTKLLATFAAESTGSSNRINRALLLEDPRRSTRVKSQTKAP